MTSSSTTIRVSAAQRERLRSLAHGRNASMTQTLDDALEALRRVDFYAAMASAESRLRTDRQEWTDYLEERDEWLTPDLTRH